MDTNRLRFLMMGGALAALGACAMPGQRPAPAAGVPPPVALAVPGAAPVSGALGSPAVLPRVTASYGAAPALSPNPVSTLPSGDISLNFADTDIRTVVDQILGNLLHQTYTIAPGVQGAATFRTVTPLGRDALIPVLETLLAQDNAALEVSNGIYEVLPTSMAATSPGLAANSTVAGTQIVPLHYLSANQLATDLQPYVGKGGKIDPVPQANALAVQGDPATRAALVSLIEAFDVDTLAGQSYEIFPVTSGDADTFSAAFQAGLGKPSIADNTASITVLPLERINAVLVVARNRSYLADAQRVYAVITAGQRETARSWHIYYMEYERANDAAYILQQAFTPDAVTAQPTPPALGDQSNSSDSSGAGGLLGSSVTSSTPTPETGSDASAPAGSNALLGPLSASASTATADTMRIVPDTQNNALMIYADAQENDEVDAMLSNIDRAPVEVRIDTAIAEVNLTGALQYGTQFFFKSGGINAVLSNGTTSSLTTSFPGFVLSGSGGDAAPLAISALQAVTKVRVLSSPELMVLDGQTASLQVGNLVPYLTQTSQSTITTGAPVINSIDYRETGVIFQVTPHVGADGLVTMDVAQEVSNVLPTVTTAGIDSPTFTVRSVTSRIAIQDGETIGLAGLISDNDSHGNAGIPFLKNIPLLGDLAATQNNNRTRTELLVLITPHVVQNQEEAADLTADLRGELPDAASVPDALQTMPSAASADPDAAVRAQIPP
jgi:general secretion pathway protein D